MAKTRVQLRTRMDALRALLYWEGSIRNSRVRSLLGLKPVQASRLLADFRKEMEGKIEEDQLGYVLVERPTKYPSVDEYLAAATEAGDKSWLEDARLLDFLQPTPWVLAPLRAACLSKTGVVLGYASMSNPKGGDRKVFPHTVVRLGNRWHIRAWCAVRKDFRDFNVSRIYGVSPTEEEAPRTKVDDLAWNKIVRVRIFPHRDLSSAQADVLKAEYSRGAAMRRVDCRGALVPYLVQALRASLDPAHEKPPAYQLEVANIDEVKPFLFGDKS